jgi:hypothetical protein
MRDEVRTAPCAYHRPHERAHRRPVGDRVALGAREQARARDDRGRERFDLSPPGRPAARPGGGRARREHLGRLPGERRRGRREGRDDGRGRAHRVVRPHRGRRRRVGLGARVQRRVRAVRRARRQGRRGRGRAADGARGGAADLDGDGARRRRPRSGAGQPDAREAGRRRRTIARRRPARPGRGGPPPPPPPRGPSRRHNPRAARFVPQGIPGRQRAVSRPPAGR